MEEQWKLYLDENQGRFLEELKNLLRIPSISTMAKYKEDIVCCAERVKNLLLKSGCKKSIIMKTKGNPIVYGERITDTNMPTGTSVRTL